ncbi:MAG: hypothetical protein K0B11_11705 [Mariniphaga sp.]|nr:hypothetical protein [Mariniphaga sp.]
MNHERNISTYELSTLRYLTNSDIPVGLNEQLKFREMNLKVYPNPVFLASRGVSGPTFLAHWATMASGGAIQNLPPIRRMLMFFIRKKP